MDNEASSHVLCVTFAAEAGRGEKSENMINDTLRTRTIHCLMRVVPLFAASRTHCRELLGERASSVQRATKFYSELRLILAMCPPSNIFPDCSIVDSIRNIRQS